MELSAPSMDQLVTPQALFAFVATAWAVSLYWEYRSWLAFGDGAPPGGCNLPMFCFVKLYGVFLWIIGNDCTDVSVCKAAPHQKMYLEGLPIKGKERPTMERWWIPQRTKGPYFHVPEVEKGIRSLTQSVVAQEVAEKPRIHAITSRLEGKGDAIAILDHVDVNAASRGLFREVVHLHSQDLSFHAVLSPACAAEVVTKKWGERFAISGRPHVLGPLRGKLIHPGMVLLYPPKTMEELEVIKKIIIAGIDYALDVGSDGLDADCNDMDAVKERAE